MGLLQDIQVSLLNEHANISPILLKLRFLADRLGSDVLEDWVRQETEGYPDHDSVPEYRRTNVTYTGTFTNGYQTLNAVSVAPYLIEKHGGKSWVDFGITDSLAVIEAMVLRAKPEGGFSIDTGNLKMKVQTKIYDNMACVELVAKIDMSSFVRILSAVRAKLLDFTLALEKNVPVAKLIDIDGEQKVSATESAKVGSITQNIFNAPVNQISSTGSQSTVQVSVVQGDIPSLMKALAANGLSREEARELALIVSEEDPEDDKEPFGRKAKAWIADKASKGAGAVWGLGLEAAKQAIAAEIKKYYGG